MSGRVVVITRNGHGAAWGFSSLLDVRLHPVYSADDVVVTSGKQLLDSYDKHELVALAARLPAGTTQRAQAQEAMASWAEEDSRRRRDEAQRAADIVFEHLTRTAPSPPTEPNELLRTIVEDRKATEGKRSTYRADHTQEHTMTTKDKEVSLAGSKGEEQKRKKAEKKVASPAVDTGAKKRATRVADSTVIRMGKDAEGKPYGGENSPKRPGSATFDRFKNYRDGITVGEVKAAGSTAGDVVYDAKHGYIVLEEQPEAEPTAEPTADTAPEEQDEAAE